MERPHGIESPGECISLKDLPVHILFIVFDNLDLRSLLALCSVCKTLYYVIKEEYLNVKSFSLLVTNQVSAKFIEKSLSRLSGSDKYRLNYHWKKKYYSERIFLKAAEKYRPWLRLNKNNLFISRGSEIGVFKRNENGISKKPAVVFKGHREDVVRFVVKDGIMISGGNDGKIFCWDLQKGKPLFHVKNRISWNENLYVDFSNGSLVSGLSVAGIIKFWTIRENCFNFETQIHVNLRLRCVALSEDGTFCSIGSSGYGTSPLTVFDLNKEMFSISISERFKSGAGIFDIVWETPSVLFTCGYDTFVRMWDIRVGQCVKSWTDPFDDAISSLASDYNWTIMSGSGVHSRVTLWDKRLSSHVDIYHMSRSGVRGPVYSFDFDPSFLFVALDSSLHVLNFSSKPLSPHIL